MTSSALQLLSGFISRIWWFFSNICFPGTNLTIAELGFFSLFTDLLIWVVKSSLFQDFFNKKAYGNASGSRSVKAKGGNDSD